MAVFSSCRRCSACFLSCKCLFADSAYAGPIFHQALLEIMPQLKIEIVRRCDDAKGFVVLPKRWIVERTIAWLNRCRRLAKDWENLTKMRSHSFISHQSDARCGNFVIENELLGRTLRSLLFAEAQLVGGATDALKQVSAALAAADTAPTQAIKNWHICVRFRPLSPDAFSNCTRQIASVSAPYRS
jgi:transposase